ncbi:CinA family nicotinamide mononucleotide deamidase-related protein [uncultured Bacteroides sp.]|uniref:CinA family nicotinamide mononucleotide deamidase-related protein n=1 Tax=uncultured Bacteroides sp. TaxID=162156 RepID=UPI002AAA7212|nr:CinA family nicotinamide mononucleotide deamidase-related protein [uncultured Bacteroides sp.]
MFAEIITIGDELLIGQVIDTNSAWIGKELNKVGIEITRVTSVRDRSEEIKDAIDFSMKRVDIVLVTGGLGPTKDDITKQTLCEYFHTKLVFSEKVFENLKKILSDRIPLNKLNKSQAMVPENSTIINNKVGSAPITWFEQGQKVLVSMPGVPQEMTSAMSNEIIPRLLKKFEVEAIIHKTFTVKNYPESVLAEKLESWEDGLPEFIKLAYLPKPGMVRLRLTGRGVRKQILEDAIAEQGTKLKEILGSNLFDEYDQPIEAVIGNILRDKGLLVATAESCTGGLIASKLTSIPGCSDYYKGSIVAYSNEIKMSFLNVSSSTLETEGAVSEKTVIEMAKGAMNALKTDCAMVTSGIAGPGGGTPEKPVGTVWIAAACHDKIITLKQESDRGRELNIERACNNALLLLLKLLK